MPIDMVSTGPDRDHTILLRHPFMPGLNDAPLATRGGRSRMLTDDGKPLRLLGRVPPADPRTWRPGAQLGLEFDQILCLARGGMRPGDVLSRVFDKPLAIMSTSSYRAGPAPSGTRLDWQYITCPRANWRARAAGRRPGRHRCHAAGGGRRLRGMPSIHRTALWR